MMALNASQARAKLYRLIDDLADSGEPVVISGRRSSAVLVSEGDWRAIQETLYLLSIPGMRQSIRRGMKTPVDKCLKDIRW
jgi:prevent-host-death family protein